ncbi:hypothetical protein L915_12071 [Phytophthora nicotianae]|uniref:Phorbol-ester/DAG-type domain-containing protein n=1 Tax=Phytophthora nicotianae TaxID=4792 RepID=W2GHP0_PHYNI|nr:hypothetical protein L915_12071 [Phytophthora nicotianae]
MGRASKRDASYTRQQGSGSYILLAPKSQNTNAPKRTAITGARETSTAPIRQVQHSSVALISSMEATFQEFNRQVAMTLLGPQPVQSSSRIEESQQRKPRPALAPKSVHKPRPAVTPKPVQQPRLGDKRLREEDNTRAVQEERDDKSAHILMPNLSRAKLLCRLCSKRGLKTRSRYGCVQCRLGFHVECFAVFHHPERYVTNPSESVQDALDVINGISRSATRRRENNSIMSFDRLTLPTSSDIQEI